MDQKLKDKVVLITGASSGIGKACALTFAKAGCRVMLAARDEMKLQQVADEIKGLGGKAEWFKADVAREEDCRDLVIATVQKFNKIDILIANAGISMRAIFADVHLDVLKQLMDINFWSVVYCTKFAMPEILKNKGSIVGMSSIAGFKGLPGRTGYSASKFAIRGFLESLRIENLKTGLHVLIACPGYTASNIRSNALNKEGRQQGDTPFDESKLMSAEYVANEILRGVIHRKQTIILGRQGKLTVLVNKFFPNFMDRMVYKVVSKEKDSPFQ